MEQQCRCDGQRACDHPRSVFVCVCVREREREREGCGLCVSVCLCVCVFVIVWCHGSSVTKVFVMCLIAG